MILIDVEPLYKQYCELEKEAMGVLDTCQPDSKDFRQWSTILTERTAYKYDLQDAPRVDAVPVVRCKDCKHYGSLDGGYLFRYFCELMDELAEGICDPDFYCGFGERRDDDATD